MLDSGPAALIAGVSVLALGAALLSLDILGLLGLGAVIAGLTVGGMAAFSVGG